MSVDATRWVWKLNNKIVTPTEKFILLAMADRAGERGECWPSLSRLEKDTGYERRAIIRARQTLIEKHLLQFTGKMEGRSNQIPVMRLMVDEWREGIYVENSDEPVIDDHGCTNVTSDLGSRVPVIEDHQSPVIDDHLESKRIEPKKEPNNNTCVFDSFWKEWPIKENKKKAKEIWKRKKLDTQADVIIQNVKDKKAYDDRWADGFIPNVTSYLNGDKWNDEIFKREKITKQMGAEKKPTQPSPLVHYSQFIGELKLMIQFNEIPSNFRVPSFEEWQQKNLGHDAKAYKRSLNL